MRSTGYSAALLLSGLLLAPLEGVRGQEASWSQCPLPAAVTARRAERRSIYVAMDDGIRLATDLFLPTGLRPDELKEVNKGLTEELENIGKHYVNTSLFLETLFRRSHFDQGRHTLRTKLCNMKKDVVQPQLERYIDQFRNAGITIDDRLSGIP